MLHPIPLSNHGLFRQPRDLWRCLLTLYYCPHHQVPTSSLCEAASCGTPSCGCCQQNLVLFLTCLSFQVGSSHLCDQRSQDPPFRTSWSNNSGVSCSCLGIPAPVRGAPKSSPLEHSHPYPGPWAEILSLSLPIFHLRSSRAPFFGNTPFSGARRTQLP